MEISMSYVWDLSGTDRQCDSYALGHLIHWIHFNHSMREPSAVIPVTAVVDDDGLVHIEGDDVSLVRWNHRPALVRDALERFGGMAVLETALVHLGGPGGSILWGCAKRVQLGDTGRKARLLRSPRYQPQAPGTKMRKTLPPFR